MSQIYDYGLLERVELVERDTGMGRSHWQKKLQAFRFINPKNMLNKQAFEKLLKLMHYILIVIPRKKDNFKSIFADQAF